MRVGTVDHHGTSRAARFNGDTVVLADVGGLDDLIRLGADLTVAFDEETSSYRSVAAPGMRVRARTLRDSQTTWAPSLLLRVP